MKKPNSGLPFNTDVSTTETLFGQGHPKPFVVASGIHVYDALMQISLLLNTAYEVSDQLLDNVPFNKHGLLWANLHSVETAKGLADALIGGLHDRL